MMSFFLLVFFYFFFETIYSTHVPSVRNCSNATLSHLRANRRLALHQLKSENHFDKDDKEVYSPAPGATRHNLTSQIAVARGASW